MSGLIFLCRMTSVSTARSVVRSTSRVGGIANVYSSYQDEESASANREPRPRMTSASPTAIALAAVVIAWMEVAQARATAETLSRSRAQVEPTLAKKGGLANRRLAHARLLDDAQLVKLFDVLAERCPGVSFRRELSAMFTMVSR